MVNTLYVTKTVDSVQPDNGSEEVIITDDEVYNDCDLPLLQFRHCLRGVAIKVRWMLEIVNFHLKLK